MVAIGSSTGLASFMKLPVTRGPAEMVDGKAKPLPKTKYYVPGSLLEAKVDNTAPLAFGVPSSVDMFFDHSPVFKLNEGAKDVKSVAWFSGQHVLRSGWAWGQQYLDGTTAVVDATAGKGKVFLMGPEVAMRAQPHGTFKFMFNALYYGPATAGK